MKIDYSGNITEIRAVEDCIRATKKYTEGLMSKKHPQQIQGADFPSRVLHKHYEIYPNVPEISWNMPVNTAIDWLYSDTPCINVSFRYDYRTNYATVIIHDDRAVSDLNRVVPGFSKAIQALSERTLPMSITEKAVRGSVDA
jgi:hypothetical protein